MVSDLEKLLVEKHGFTKGLEFPKTRHVIRLSIKNVFSIPYPRGLRHVFEDTPEHDNLKAMLETAYTRSRAKHMRIVYEFIKKLPKYHHGFGPEKPGVDYVYGKQIGEKLVLPL